MKDNNIQEKYLKIDEDDRSFDIEFWQKAGEEAIFKAAYEMVIDYLILRGKNDTEQRLQRTIESFKKI
ncbi:MAG: hypothetical protein N2445_03795 [Acidobacteria bacterium]|nr:hypothetical protein [Acidobacteriota bacterium]